jgi:hypothetical protein
VPDIVVVGADVEADQAVLRWSPTARPRPILTTVPATLRPTVARTHAPRSRAARRAARHRGGHRVEHDRRDRGCSRQKPGAVMRAGRRGRIGQRPPTLITENIGLP